MDQSTTLNKIPLFLITGFLGSGKTSVLKQILIEIGSSKRIAIVQNEFAPGRTDSAELESSGIDFDLLEINNGSVFCACLLDDFISRLGVFIRKFKPEVIFLEATGLADPVSLGQILQSPEAEDHVFLGGVWTVVDCLNFTKSHRYLQRVRHQIQIADIILFNKSDLAYPGEDILQQVAEWNPFGSKYISENGRFDMLDSVLDQELRFIGTRTIDKIDIIQSDSLPRPDIGSCVVRTQKAFSENAIRQFHQANKHNILRMKGYAKCPDGTYLLVQSVYEDLSFKKAVNWSGPTEIILMGPGIKPGPISKEFLKSGINAK